LKFDFGTKLGPHAMRLGHAEHNDELVHTDLVVKLQERLLPCPGGSRTGRAWTPGATDAEHGGQRAGRRQTAATRRAASRAGL